MPVLDPPRRLQNHSPRMGMMPGVLTWFMALACLGVGGYIVAIALGPWIPERELDAPRWVVACIGGIFLLPGMLITASLLIRHRAASHGPVWDRQRRWPRRRLGDDSLRDLRLRFLWVLGVAVFLTPFNYFVSKDVSRGRWMSPEVFGVGFFDLVLVFLLLGLLFKLLRRLRYGRSYLELSAFPIALGRSVNLRLEARALQPGMLLEARLMAIQANWQSDMVSGSRRQTAAVFCVYEDIQRREVQRAGECLLEWQLPDAPATTLGEFPTAYWELHVSAARRGMDYSAGFLLPVYRV